MASIASWIYDKPLRGNYTFTHDEVAQAFSGMSAGSIARALTREVSMCCAGLCRSRFTWTT